MSDREAIEGALAIAREMRRIHSGPERWTKGWFARNRHGHRVSTESPSAVRFCLIGARTKAVNQLGVSCAESEMLIIRTLGRLPGGSADWNDAKDRRFADVVAVEEKLVKTLERRLAQAGKAS